MASLVWRQHLLPQRLRELCVCCPYSLQTYATFHLDSSSKVLNHLLAVLGVCNIFLFLSSWHTLFGVAASSIHAVFISILLLIQTSLVYIIINNTSHYSSRGSASLNSLETENGEGGGLLSSLRPSDFMLGVALGITVGGSILAFTCSSSFSHPPWPCNAHNYVHTLRQSTQHSSITTSATSGSNSTLYNNETEPLMVDPEDSIILRCHKLYIQGSRTRTYLWWWSSMIMWLNCCIACLLAVGQRDLSRTYSLSSSYTYEPVGAVDEAHVRQSSSGGASFPGDLPAHHPNTHSNSTNNGNHNHASANVSSSFVGDYSRIPEIRSEGNNVSNNNHSAIPSTEKSCIVVAV